MFPYLSGRKGYAFLYPMHKTHACFNETILVVCIFHSYKAIKLTLDAWKSRWFQIYVTLLYGMNGSPGMQFDNVILALDKSANISSSGENGFNIRTNGSPKSNKIRCPEE